MSNSTRSATTDRPHPSAQGNRSSGDPYRLISLHDAEFLNLREYPAILNASQTAVLLGFHEDSIALLVKGKLLEPLGNPPPRAAKLFATIDILELRKDTVWLSAAVKDVREQIAGKNARTKKRTTQASQTTTE